MTSLKRYGRVAWSRPGFTTKEKARQRIGAATVLPHPPRLLAKPRVSCMLLRRLLRAKATDTVTLSQRFSLEPLQPALSPPPPVLPLSPAPTYHFCIQFEQSQKLNKYDSRLIRGVICFPTRPSSAASAVETANAS